MHKQSASGVTDESKHTFGQDEPVRAGETMVFNEVIRNQADNKSLFDKTMGMSNTTGSAKLIQAQDTAHSPIRKRESN